MDEVKRFRERFIDESVDKSTISKLLPPVISEDGTSYAFE
jgi:hypothetical protein